jgi:hypothetical protein
MDLNEIVTKLSKIGLNVYSVGNDKSQLDFNGFQYSRVVVFGSTGRTLWDSFVSFLKVNPSFLVDNKHPLDQFIRQYIEQDLRLYQYQHGLRASPWQRWKSDSSICYQWAQCSILNADFVDFRLLAESTHLGYRSPLGLLIHPKYGPWMGLRLALFTTAEWNTTELSLPSPCISCDKPCISACPANAVDERGWNMQGCYDYQKLNTNCHTGCLSRKACPIGTQYQYPDAALHYHHDKLNGRQALAKSLGALDAGQIDPDIDLMPWQVD